MHLMSIIVLKYDLICMVALVGAFRRSYFMTRADMSVTFLLVILQDSSPRDNFDVRGRRKFGEYRNHPVPS